MKEQEKTIINRIVELENYRLEEPDKMLTILEKEINYLQSLENELYSTQIDNMQNIGLQKSMYAYTRRYFEKLLALIRDSGQSQQALREQLEAIRAKKEQVVEETENRSLLDGSQP